MKIKISVLVLLIGFGIISFILLNNSEKTPKDTTIYKTKFGIYNGETSLLALIAKEKGYFKEENLDIELKPYPSGYHAMTGMLNGEVDYANCAEYVASKYSFSNPNFKILASMAIADINKAVAKTSKNINNTQDMKGKRIGTTIGTATEYYTGVFLDYNKVDLKDVSLVDIHPSKRMEVFEKDEVDVLFTWEPTTYKLQKKYKEEAKIYPMPLGFEFYFLIVSDKKFHEKNPIISSKILKSLYKAQNYVRENPNEIKRFVKNYFDFDEEYTDYIIKKHNYELTFPYVLSSVLNNQFKWLQKNKLVEGKAIKLDTLFDTSILKKIDEPSVTILE